MKSIVFDKTTRELVLEIFNKKVDNYGYIIESDTQERVKTPDGNDVKIENFAGFVPGSEIIITKDMPSLLQYANQGE